MKKQIAKIIVGFAIIFFIGICIYENSVEASTKTTIEKYKVTANLNVRAGSGTNYKILGTLKKETQITTTGKTSNGWYKLSYNGKVGYVSGKYLTKVTTSSTKNTSATKQTGNRYKVTVDGLNLRKGAGTTYKVITTIPKDINVTVHSKKGNWSYVSVGKYKGWLSNKYITKTFNTYKSAGLVEITAKDGFVIDLQYKTKKNFMGYQIYPSKAKALLRSGTAKKLKKANQLAEKYGYKIKIWDAYRPLSIQWEMYKKVSNINYVAPPTEKWSNHSKGIAVDITLVNSKNKELVMPTKFDDFSKKASINYKGNSKTAQKNMELLISIMKKSGFTTLSSEWWHYNDTDEYKYHVLDVPLY